MRWSIALLVALGATACAGPDRPDYWTAERAVPVAADSTPVTGVCGELEILALGAHADETDLAAVVDELARLGAVVGATEALVHLAEARDGDADAAAPALAAAAGDLDASGYSECEIPLFSAVYVTTSWAQCHGPVPIAAHSVLGDLDLTDRACHADDSPGYLPCWDTEAGFIPIDCRTGETVRAEAGSWVAI